MKNSEILKKAQDYIRSGHCRHICSAIDEAIDVQCDNEDKAYDFKTYDNLCEWIKIMLEGHSYFEGWLYYKGNVKILDPNFFRYKKSYIGEETELAKLLRAHRIAWLDKLIKICKEEENENERKN